MLVQLVAILSYRPEREESKHKSFGPPLPAAIIVMNIIRLTGLFGQVMKRESISIEIFHEIY